MENQATDRAFRIGQKNNVLVHKFVCQGTIEEKIDALIEAKKGLSDEVVAGGDEIATGRETESAARPLEPGRRGVRAPETGVGLIAESDPSRGDTHALERA